MHWGPWYVCSWLAYVLKEQGKYEEAVTWYKQAIQRTYYVTGPRDHIPVIYNNMGVILYYRLGKHKEGEQALRDSIRLNPNDSTAVGNLVDMVLGGESEVKIRKFQQGLDLMEKEKYREAEAVWRKLLLTDPGRVDIRNNLGSALLNQKKYLAADAHLREARGPIREGPIWLPDATYDHINDSLNNLEKSPEFKKAMEELKAAKEQGESAAELKMEAMKGQAMICFDESRGCAYTSDHSLENAVFAPAPQSAESALPAAAKAKAEKDPEYIELRKKKEKIEKEYKENYEALQAAWSQRDQQPQGSRGAIDLVIVELRNKLTEKRSEKRIAEIGMEKVAKKYVLD